MGKISRIALILVLAVAFSSFHQLVPSAIALNEVSVMRVAVRYDTYLYEAYPDNNYDEVGFISVGYSAVTSKRVRSLVYFPISLPAGSELVSATLVLTLKGTYNYQYSSQTQYIYRLYRTWSESRATWRRRTSTSYWINPGGDFYTDGPKVGNSYGYFTVRKTDPQGKVFSVDITPFVEGVLEGRFRNYGLIIVSSLRKGSTHFYDSEYSDAGKRPYVIIRYRMPKIKASPSTATITVKQGELGSLPLTASYQVIDPATLSIVITTNLPGGISKAFLQMQKTATDWEGTLRVRPSTDVAPGTYYFRFYFRAKASTNGDYVNSNPVTVKVVVKSGGTFSLVPNPSSLSINRGDSRDIELSVVGEEGFTGTVSLSVASKPTGFNVEIADSSVAAGSSTTLRISVSSTVEPGTYTVVVKGVKGSLEAQGTIEVTVTRRQINYELQVSPSSVKVRKGESASITVTVSLVSGEAENVQLTVEGLPGDATYTFARNPVSPSGSTTLTITAGSTVGRYTVVIKGATASGVEKTATLLLEIAEEEMKFSVSVTPSSLEMNQGEEGSVQVRVEHLGGEKKPVTLRVSGVPSGATATLSKTSLTPPGSATLSISSGSAKGTFTLLIEAEVDGRVESTTLSLVIKEKRCIVATATYGSELSPEVSFLRSFRDGVVLSTYSGVRFYAAFNAFYYSWSPYLAQFIHENQWAKAPAKAALYPLILGLYAASTLSAPIVEASPELGVYVAGALSSALIGLFYFAPIAWLAAKLLGRGTGKAARYAALAFLASAAASAIAAYARLDLASTFATSSYVLSMVALAALAPAAVIEKLRRAKPA